MRKLTPITSLPPPGANYHIPNESSKEPAKLELHGKREFGSPQMHQEPRQQNGRPLVALTATNLPELQTAIKPNVELSENES